VSDGANVSGVLTEHGVPGRDVTVTLSNELVHLLSEQMYRSPTKAIEELVVNSYDADARRCDVFVPLAPDDTPWVAVFDNGHGMDEDGLQDLWQIGRSSKRDAELQSRLGRKMIGKFGIGKLATYSIASLVTYVSKHDGVIRGVTLDYRAFQKDPTGGRPITLTVQGLQDAVLESGPLAEVINRLSIAPELTGPSWTLVVLEDLKPKMGKIRRRDLNWVLSSAMPLGTSFSLALNGATIESRKASFEEIASFDVTELPLSKLKSLEENTGSNWRAENGSLVSDSFPSGISGSVLVTAQSLYTGKSADLARSHGFFVRVRERLVDEADPLFGLEPLSYSVFNRFRADLKADDLDAYVTAPREGFGASDEVSEFRLVLAELFYEARSRYEAAMKERAARDRRGREDERSVVDKDAVELPLADALSRLGLEEGEFAENDAGADADNSWFYVRLPPNADRVALITQLLGEERNRYRFSETGAGRSGRMVELDLAESTFLINVDHPVVQAHTDPSAQPLLEDMLAAEVMLEVYMRAAGVAGPTVGSILERRDLLLRGLAADHIVSPAAIAADLRNSADNERELEINIVIAARALGFVAKHLSGAGRADGIARFNLYPGGEQRITLEAKSSEEVPSLGAIDFAGLREHMNDEIAIGCLLVAPAYPGQSKGADAAAAKRAEEQRVSCWTVEQLAAVVERAEERHLGADDLLKIVTTAFAPDAVTSAVDELLGSTPWSPRELYGAVVDALRAMDGRLTDRHRTIDMIASEVSSHVEFRTVKSKDVENAVRAVANASQGLLHVLGNDRVVIRGDYDELERRVAQLLGRVPAARRTSTFREPRAES
jgi:hypothetical protein